MKKCKQTHYLSKTDIWEIRQLHKMGYTNETIAKGKKLALSTVTDVINRKTHVDKKTPI